MVNRIKYKKRYCAELEKHMEKGYSFQSFGGVISVGRQTLYDWVNRYPEFKKAKQTATENALKYFESRLAAKVSGQKVSGFDSKLCDTSALIFALKTRFYEIYGDKQKIEHTGADGGPIQTSTVDYSKLTTDELKAMEKMLLKASK